VYEALLQFTHHAVGHFEPVELRGLELEQRKDEKSIAVRFASPTDE
jgi:hypothetical protein